MEINLLPFQELRGVLDEEVGSDDTHLTVFVVVPCTLRIPIDEFEGEFPEPGCEIAILRTETGYVVTGAKSKVTSATLAICSKP